MQDYQVAAIITAVLMSARDRAAFVAAEPRERMDLMGKSWLAAYEIVELAKSLHEDEVEQADRESPP